MHEANPNIAIFASGQGSNALALMDAFERRDLPATLALVLCNCEDAPVIQKAKDKGYPTVVVPHKGLPRVEHEAHVLETVEKAGISHILLAGYMRILTADFLTRFQATRGGHVLNIHPSLLPLFPGLHAAEQQWQAGVETAGATVHFVIPEVDAGPIILQRSLKVRGDEGAAGLGERIRSEIEHSLYPDAVQTFLDKLSPLAEKVSP